MRTRRGVRRLALAALLSSTATVGPLAFPATTGAAPFLYWSSI